MASKRNKKRRQQKHSAFDFMDKSYDSIINDKVTELFGKKFQYTCAGGDKWILPPVDAMFESESWIDKELHDLKNSLNTIKSQLSDKDITKWHAHTQNMNKAGNIINHVKRYIRPELCTQAWCKFYEIVATYPIANSKQGGFSSLHLCEAPGAFITGLNHYLHSNGKLHVFVRVWGSSI